MKHIDGGDPAQSVLPCDAAPGRHCDVECPFGSVCTSGADRQRIPHVGRNEEEGHPADKVTPVITVRKESTHRRLLQ